MESFQGVGKALPTKESGLIKQVMRLIDNKKFAKALKKVEKVLLACPDDGDSLSLKGSILNSLGKREEALVVSKQGLMKNLKGPLSWHTLSQVYYSDKNYSEAYKSEQKAFALAKTNNTILRCLSLLQLHMRDYPAFRDSRKEILVSNFTGLINWIAYAVAEQFCGNLEQTDTILNSFLKSMEKHMSNQELSETLLYKARILEELKKFNEMFELLAGNREKIRDTPTYLEYLTRAGVESGHFQEALGSVLELIGMNSENSKYFEWYFRAKSYNTEEEKLLGLSELKAIHPKSSAIEREELNFLHSNIIEKFPEYLFKRIRKGIPSIFSDIKGLCKEQPRGAIILDFVQSNVEALKDSKAFKGSDKLEQPQCLMWMLYLHSQLLDFNKKCEEALQCIQEAIQHTPTVPDLYLFKAKVLKHLGSLDKASEAAEEARVLDLGDRYLNNKSSKYLLRNNKIIEAELSMGLFCKEKANELNVHDMQSMWFELELAEALFRTDSLQKSAEEFRWIEKHLIEMFEDQYDFHFYCFRKMNLNSYVDFMQFEDTLISHKHFLRAGLGLVRIFEKDASIVPISEASRILKILIKHHSHDLETNQLGFRVFMQREKYILALKCISKLKTQANFLELKEDYLKRIQAKEMKEAVREVILRVLEV